MLTRFNPVLVASIKVSTNNTLKRTIFTTSTKLNNSLSSFTTSPSENMKEYLKENRFDNRKLQNLELVAGKPTQYLSFLNLPQSTTNEDILRIIKNNEDLKNNIISMHFPLNYLKQSKGICTIKFKDTESAIKFGLHGLTYYLSSNLIKLKFNDEKSFKTDLLSSLPYGAGGKTVLITGLPKPFDLKNPPTFLNDYKLNYDGEDITQAIKVVKGNPLSTVSSILVELESKSQAYQLMHNLNLSYYNKSRFGENFQLKVNIVY